MPAGRPRKPTALHELQGTGQASRMNPNEPTPSKGLPDRPNWVDDDPVAASIYSEVTNYVHRMGVATEVDGIALSLLSDQLSIYLELRKQIREEGTVITVTGSQGQEKRMPHPALAQLNTTLGGVHKLLREYGLTAASRPNVSAIEEKEVSSFEEFMDL